MIFVTVGSQKFQFNRLLKAIDDLIEKRIIQEEVFVQSGYCDYVPTHFKYKDFLDRDEIVQKIEEADIVITHGGTGSIFSAVNAEKKVIVVPRKAAFGEHVDDHQNEIIGEFQKMNLIYACYDLDYLADAVEKVRQMKFDKYYSNTEKIIESIEAFILA